MGEGVAKNGPLENLRYYFGGIKFHHTSPDQQNGLISPFKSNFAWHRLPAVLLGLYGFVRTAGQQGDNHKEKNWYPRLRYHTIIINGFDFYASRFFVLKIK